MSKNIQPVIRDKEFAKRLNEACNNNSHVPPYNFGRLTWIRKNMLEYQQEKISTETVRKWLSGESRPRPTKMKKLADLLQVEESWLSLGIKSNMDTKQRAARNVMASGAASILAGFIQIAEGSIAFPDGESDEDFTAIIGHKKYEVHTSLAIAHDNDMYRFSTPVNHTSLTIVGAIPTSHTNIIFLKLSNETLKKYGVLRGGHLEIIVQKIGSNFKCGPDQIPKIADFTTGL